VVTANGQLLNPAIVIPDNASAITIGRDGTVSAELVAGGGQVQLGQITLARFVNPAGLQPMGQNLYKQTAASGAPQVQVPGVGGAGTLRQGMLEASNVSVVEEMVAMIETQRAYEVNSKSISATDSMLKYLNQTL
jgi:flagellar basal-body rod protein FlgG